MKRLILTFALLAASFGLASAQNYMVVNSETVFKSIPEYNSALERIETLADQYQQQVDDRFAAVETLYNNYMAQRSSLSESARQTRENAILQREKEAAEFQESLFGTDGELIEEASGTDPADPAARLLDDREFLQAARLRPRDRHRRQPDGALQLAAHRLHAANHRCSEIEIVIKHL